MTPNAVRQLWTFCRPFNSGTPSCTLYLGITAPAFPDTSLTMQRAQNPPNDERSSVLAQGTSPVWDNSSPPWVGWRGGGYREGTRSATRCAITTVRTSSRKGSGSLAGYAQSPRGASTGATGNGLEANARAEQPKQTYVGAKGTGASLPLFTVGDGCQV